MDTNNNPHEPIVYSATSKGRAARMARALRGFYCGIGATALETAVGHGTLNDDQEWERDADGNRIRDTRVTVMLPPVLSAKNAEALAALLREYNDEPKPAKDTAAQERSGSAAYFAGRMGGAIKAISAIPIEHRGGKERAEKALRAALALAIAKGGFHRAVTVTVPEKNKGGKRVLREANTVAGELLEQAAK